MKTTLIALFALLVGSTAFAQQDSIRVEKKGDTINLGGIIILKEGARDGSHQIKVTIGSYRKSKPSNISTNSFIFDIGFSNWADKTDYSSATANHYLVSRSGTPDIVANDLKLRTIKSVNVNIWFFMQRMNLIKHYVNLKYGLGLELNNYRFKTAISLHEADYNPYDRSQFIPHPFIFKDSISFSKNKLAADYITIPIMLNFNTNPDYSRKGISVSAGVSMGFLYSSRNKQISDARGKRKNRGNFDLEEWKFSYVAELGLGPVRLYGSYSPNSIFTNELDYRPYSIGIRLSNW